MPGAAFTLSSCMTVDVRTLAPEAPVGEALRCMAEGRFSCMVAVEGRVAVGIFTERDAMDLLSLPPSALNEPLRHFMSRHLECLPASCDVREAYQHMKDRRIRHLVVNDVQGELAGIVSETDLARHLGAEFLIDPKPVSSIMRRDAPSLPRQSSVAEALRVLRAGGESCVVVVEGVRAVGILTERDVLRLVGCRESLETLPLDAVMSGPLLTVRPDTLLQEAAWIMARQQIRRLVVVDAEERWVGVLGQHEVVSTLDGRYIPFLRELIGRQRLALDEARGRLAQAESLSVQQRILQQIPDAVTVIDADSGQFIEANDQACRHFALDRESLLGREVFDLCDGVSSPAELASLRQRLRDVERVRLETHHRRGDGTRLPVECNLSLVMGEGREMFVAVSRDMSERQEMLQALRASEAMFRALFERHDAVMLLIEPQSGAIVDANSAAARFYGYAREHLRTLRIDEMNALSPEDVLAERCNALVERRNHFVFPHRLADGSLRTVEVHSTPVEVQGRTLLFSIIHDISDRLRAEQALREREREWQAIVENLPSMVFVKDAVNLRFLSVNSAGERVLGRSRQELIGRDNHELFPREQADFFASKDREALSSDAVVSIDEETIRTPHGDRILRTRKVRILDEKGVPKYLLGIAEDMTESKAQEERLRLAAAVFRSTREGVMVTDMQQRITLINQAFTDLTGYEETEVLGCTPNLLKSGRHDARFYAEMWASLEQTGHWQGEIWNRRRNGEVFPEWMTISVVRDESGRPTHYVGVFSDISRVKQSEEQMERLAHYDPLTGLPNRLLLQSRLEHALEKARRHHRRLAVLFLDLDRFKNVNDSLGHQAGDQLLKLVTQRLAHRVRGMDTLGRLGGDEFVAIVEDIGEPRDVLGLVSDLLDELAHPFRLMGEIEVYIGGSIGISLYPDDGENAHVLIRNADAAMYQAKSRGRQTYAFYTESLTRHAEERLHIESALRRALERDELVLHFQPQIELSSGEMIGAEALVRWAHPERGLLGPDVFIPLAEETGLILALGDWVLRAACQACRHWPLNPHSQRPFVVAINLSSRQFLQQDFPGRVAAILHECGIPPEQIELELTESALMEQGGAALSMLHALKSLGVSLALDDFGTGYSSLAYLKQLPIDTLKIDRSFVRDIPGDADDMAIAATIIAMARTLRMSVVAEGIETEEQLAFLREQGCAFGQGYLFSAAMPADVFRRRLHAVTAEL